MKDTGYVRKVAPAFFDPFRGKHPLLEEIDIELTERCNNRCVHCFINRPEHDPETKNREMETEFVLDLLHQAADLGCLTVRFTGGEPLLRPDFPELYLTTRKLGMQVILFTNARLITRELAELFSRVHLGRLVEVSVYGMHAESYDSVVGIRGAYSEFRRGIGLLQEFKIPFVVKAPLLPQIMNETAELESWAATIPWMEETPPGYSMNFDLRGRRDDKEKNKRIAALRLTPEETVSILARDSGYVSGMREFCQRFIGATGPRLFPCGAGHRPCIDSYGNVQMCLLLRDPATVYNLRIGSLREAITEFFPELRNKMATSRDYLKRCSTCFLKGLCEQCPAKSWMEHGTLDTPVEYLCEVAHEQARHLGLLDKTECAWEIKNWQERVEHFLGFSEG